MWDIALLLPLKKIEGQTLQKQLQTRFRTIIRTGQLPALTKLPSSRVLAIQLDIARNTVIAVYNQLRDEGYLQVKATGTYVAEIRINHLKNNILEIDGHFFRDQIETTPLRLSMAFQVGEPALTHFPFAVWKRRLTDAVQRKDLNILNYGNPLGEWELRKQITAHLRLTRGVICQPNQVILTTGTRQTLNLCVKLLTQAQDYIWIEEPGYRAAREVFIAEKRQVYGVTLDSEGLAPEIDHWAKFPPKLIYTTPSHQFPTGTVMSIARRLALLQAAQKYQSWIIEDDYDSEFRYRGEPIPAMQGLIADAPVIYIGSFSKVLAPAIGIGFMVVPQALQAKISTHLMHVHTAPSRQIQHALASLMQNGEFSRHLSQMKRLYKTRQTILRTALQPLLDYDAEIQILGGYCGMHLLVSLPNHIDEQALVKKMKASGYTVSMLSDYYYQHPAHKGIILGYGNTSDAQLRQGAEKLIDVYMDL